MTDITPYTEQIQNAVYGEEVRESIIDALQLINDDNNSYQGLKNEIIEAKDHVDEQVILAQQIACDNGYTLFKISHENGHLYNVRTENISDNINFNLNSNGHLEVII